MNPAKPQPPPLQGGVRILDLVLQEMTERAETGRAKYGTYLQANNGRNPLIDAYQEAQDLCMYLRQAIEEGDRVHEERERCIQLFLAYAFDAHGWKLKDGEADGVRMMLEDLRSGAEVFEPFVFLESDPDNHGMPSIRPAQQVQAWTERPEPTPGEPTAEPESE